MTTNRLCAFSMFLFSLAMILYVIPNQTEAVSYGWVKPDSLPNIACYSIAACALFQFLFDQSKVEFDAEELLKSLFFLTLGLGSLYAMGRFGFMVVSPVLALLIMLMVGEKRPLWLFSGVVLVPACIWLIIVTLLERQLP